MVVSAVVCRLHAASDVNVMTCGRNELDQRALHSFRAEQRPDYFFIAAIRVGSIQVNNHYRADFLGQDLRIEANLILGAQLANAQRPMFLGSICICPQPIKLKRGIQHAYACS